MKFIIILKLIYYNQVSSIPEIKERSIFRKLTNYDMFIIRSKRHVIW